MRYPSALCIVLALVASLATGLTVSAVTAPAAEAADRQRFPTPRTSGTPRDWKPKRTIHGDRRVTRRGAVIRDLRIINGDLIVAAPDVTIRRVQIRGGRIWNETNGRCHNGLLVARTTIARSPTRRTRGDTPVIGPGGYVARRVKIVGVPEGFRVGGRSVGCGRVRIVNSFARIRYPDVCRDWHGDALQGYGGPRLVIRNSVLRLVERSGCGGTAPFFYPRHQGNRRVVVDRLLVAGGGYPFRLGQPGRVTGLKVVRRSWGYGPIDVNCPAVNTWRASVVMVRAGLTRKVRNLRCSTRSGY